MGEKKLFTVHAYMTSTLFKDIHLFDNNVYHT